MIEKSIFNDGANKNLTHTKMEKGITLVALIITIVILLILAVVSINAIQNDGILEYAENAKFSYAQSQANEQILLDSYISKIEENMNIEYETYSKYEEVNVGDESFYVLYDSDKTQRKVVLLAKYCIDLENLDQKEDVYPRSNATEWEKMTTAFSQTNYFSDYPDNQDLIDTTPNETHYANYKAYQYGIKLGGTGGRLLLFSEAEELVSDPSKYGILGWRINTGDCLAYWYGTKYEGDEVYMLDGANLSAIHVNYGNNTNYAVRPVIEIPKSLITR
jgi:competence protein ComGC